MRKNGYLIVIIGVLIFVNGAEAASDYAYNHSINGSTIDQGIIASDTVRTSDSSNFDGVRMKYTWEVDGIQVCMNSIQFGSANSVTGFCSLPNYDTEKEGVVKAEEQNNGGNPIHHHGNPSSADFTIKGLPEFGKTGPVISIFLIGAFYISLRKRTIKK